MKPFLFLLLPLAMVGCVGTVKSESVRPDPSIHLRAYRKLALVLVDASGGTSVNAAAGGPLLSGQVTNGSDLAPQILRSLQFNMASVGFQLVDRSQADLIGEFSIGQIRRDPIAGWIADEAILVLKNPATGDTINMFRFRSGNGITPTVNRLLDSITESMKKAY